MSLGGGDGAGAADAEGGRVGEGVHIEGVGAGEGGVIGVEEDAGEGGIGGEGGAEVDVGGDADFAVVGVRGSQRLRGLRVGSVPAGSAMVNWVPGLAVMFAAGSAPAGIEGCAGR